jgi:hypothetical protein
MDTNKLLLLSRGQLAPDLAMIKDMARLLIKLHDHVFDLEHRLARYEPAGVRRLTRKISRPSRPKQK